MTDYTIAEKLRKYYLSNPERKAKINICTAIPNWNGCDYCDVYSGVGLPCWKQDGKHDCCQCREENRN